MTKNYNPTQSTWMVMINGDYMVKATFTEEKGACSVEHFFLDDIRWGIQAAQAFSREDMQTEFFSDCLMSCKLVSIEDIMKLSREAHEKAMAPINSEIDSLKSEMERIAKRIADLEHKKTYACESVRI